MSRGPAPTCICGNCKRCRKLARDRENARIRYVPRDATGPRCGLCGRCAACRRREQAGMLAAMAVPAWTAEDERAAAWLAARGMA